MKRKPLEKLSDRLTKLFLACVKEYDWFAMGMLGSEYTRDLKPVELAKRITKICMDMIDEYEPEDIE